MREVCTRIYELLSRRYEIREGEFVGLVARRNLFEHLVAVLLSQNTNDKNAIRALSNLKSRLGKLTPEKVLSLDVGELAQLIKPAGLHLQRARRIVELASYLRDRLEEFESEVRRMDVLEAREVLMNLPGVGDKTADVVLLVYFGKPAFPVDTHIKRITTRLGFVKGGSYKKVSGFWQSCLPPDKYLETHLLLIQHGRAICKARKPLCHECPIKEFCEYYKSRGLRQQ
ncbi:HhH-GPD family protein [Thermogladius calderae 1633]|uniref:HhH-GPD family protein n=1 Tax=Thermogladius calderae (strain DSM 22663 / VKM B-2946 / 1633) TaxID=1184251 RepID=I3TER5_THEC1|nr:endonuclease III [Thermogladius calderae]AFK51253.1 HhH-GPD family protein [Thermogladius calderae 1633]